jgi:hypothetical protein
MWIGKKNLFPQVREIVIIHAETTFDGPIRYPPLALDKCEDLLQQLVKIHGASSPPQLQCSRQYTWAFLRKDGCEKQ